MNETLRRKFKFFSEEHPECNEEGKYYGSPGELYELHYYLSPIRDGKELYAIEHTALFTKIKFADESIKEYMRTNEKFRGFRLTEMDYRDWGIVYIGTCDKNGYESTYVKFYIMFKSVHNKALRYL